MELKESIQKYAEEPLTKQLALDLLKDYNRPYDKINELVKQGILLLVKRGIYAPGPKLNIARPEPFLVANHLLGPSYISLESAMSYWGLIPEKVYETSSVTIRKSKMYKTPLGRFSYTHLPLPYYSFGIQRVKLTERQTVMVATPEKALCDKIATTSGILFRSKKQVMEVLVEDFRIEEQELRHLDIKEISKWVAEAPKKSSFHLFLKTIKDL